MLVDLVIYMWLENKMENNTISSSKQNSIYNI
nr:MAG TPA: hypothetical protein [Caudoviricetes sp.]